MAAAAVMLRLNDLQMRAYVTGRVTQ